MDFPIINNREELKKLLVLAMYAGRIMLKSGAETYRVEDTIERICKSRKNIEFVDAFVTPTGIFISLEFENEVVTHLKRVKNISRDLNKISLVNDFSRKFVSSNISVEEGMAELTSINKKITYSQNFKSIFGSSAAAFSCLMYKGTFYDFIATYLVSFLVITILHKLSTLNLTFFIDNFIGAFLASMFAFISIKLGLGQNLDKIIIGSIMYLVPGVSITNAIRDTMSGDFLSGSSRAVEAIFSALAIAFGVGIILNLHLKGVI